MAPSYQTYGDEYGGGGVPLDYGHDTAGYLYNAPPMPTGTDDVVSDAYRRSLYSQLESLEKQLQWYARNQTDALPFIEPSIKAEMAKVYSALSKVQPESPKTPTGSWMTPKPDQPGWYNPTTGELARNPFYDPAYGMGGGDPGPTPYQQWQMSRGDDDTAFNRMHLEREWGRTLEQDAYARQQDELAMERWAQEQARLREHQQQQMELQRRNAMAGLASSMMQLQQSTAPYAKGPNQEFHHGFERGGAYEKLLNMGGATYDPQQYKAPTVRIDPEQQWAWAMGKMGG